jgi:gliding motility-associated protein GldC
MSEVQKTANIVIQVGLDQNNVPTTIHWQAEDSPDTPNPVACKAFLLSLFDADHRDTFKIDLWTKEMQVIEMDKFFYQTLRGMADTYLRSTNNKELANDMQKFVQYFGEKTEVLPK